MQQDFGEEFLDLRNVFTTLSILKMIRAISVKEEESYQIFYLLFLIFSNACLIFLSSFSG